MAQKQHNFYCISSVRRSDICSYVCFPLAPYRRLAALYATLALMLFVDEDPYPFLLQTVGKYVCRVFCASQSAVGKVYIAWCFGSASYSSCDVVVVVLRGTDYTLRTAQQMLAGCLGELFTQLEPERRRDSYRSAVSKLLAQPVTGKQT